jgi:hypothetical protein
MNISDDDVQAFVDGALPPGERARVEAAIASDVLVAARVARERRRRAGARDALVADSVAVAPDRLRGLRATRAHGVEASRSADASAEPSRALPRPRWRMPLIAMAATGLALLAAQRLRTPGGDIAVDHGALVPRGELKRRLDRGLASERAPASGVALGLSFRSVDGRVCRSFIAPEARVAGLACREASGWTLPVVSRLESGAAGDAAQADAMPAEVLAAIGSRLQGDAFDAAQERQARDGGWR